MITQRVNILSQRRNASFFGNLGDSITKIVPKPHIYFQVTKPVGVTDAPKLLSELPKERWLTWDRINIPKRMWDFYFDGVTRRTRVSEIQKELAYGGMYDFHVYNKTRGRLFQSPPSYFRRDKALYFPNFPVRTLQGKKEEILNLIKNKEITILRVFSTGSGVEMIEKYFKIPDSEDSYLSKSGFDMLSQQYPNTQVVELILSENKVKNFVHRFIAPSSVRKTRPESQYNKYLIAVRDEVLKRDIREKLLMTNMYSGYVYVIDNKSKVRWVGAGLPDSKDLDGLWKAVKGLEKEVILKAPRQ